MIDTIEAININFEEDGVLIVKELDKEVISKKGAWVTVLFRYQDWNEKNQAYSADKYSIRRYQKKAGEYRVQAKFALTDKEQAKQLVALLGEWLAREDSED